MYLVQAFSLVQLSVGHVLAASCFSVFLIPVPGYLPACVSIFSAFSSSCKPFSDRQLMLSFVCHISELWPEFGIYSQTDSLVGTCRWILGRWWGWKTDFNGDAGQLRHRQSKKGKIKGLNYYITLTIAAAFMPCLLLLSIFSKSVFTDRIISVQGVMSAI